MFSDYFITVADVPFANVLSYTSVRILPSSAVVWAWNNSVLATLPPHRPTAAYSVQIVPINKKRIQSAWPRWLRCYICSLSPLKFLLSAICCCCFSTGTLQGANVPRLPGYRPTAQRTCMVCMYVCLFWIELYWIELYDLFSITEVW